MALRRRDWTDLLLQIIDFYVIATGVEQLIWNDITFSYIVCINVLYIPLIVFLKLTSKSWQIKHINTADAVYGNYYI